MGKNKRRHHVLLYSRARLNALALGVAFAGATVPFLMQTPSNLATDMQSLLAASGASLTASVLPNPTNTLAQQLADKEHELNDREAALQAEEAAHQGGYSAGAIFGLLSFILSVILLILIGINFYLDSRRGKKKGIASGKYSVDLS